MGKRWETIVANESGPNAGVEGVAEDVKGRAKEAEAEKARAEASAAEAEQRSHQ